MKFKDISPGLVLSVSLEHRIADSDELLAGRRGTHSVSKFQNQRVLGIIQCDTFNAMEKLSHR